MLISENDFGVGSSIIFAEVETIGFPNLLINFPQNSSCTIHIAIVLSSLEIAFLAIPLGSEYIIVVGFWILLRIYFAFSGTITCFSSISIELTKIIKLLDSSLFLSL